jgi:hypothetical protein
MPALKVDHLLCTQQHTCCTAASTTCMWKLAGADRDAARLQLHELIPGPGLRVSY